jgi:long-chain acyl-CoA synthetase
MTAFDNSNPNTVNDIFFTVVDSASPRVMMFEKDGQWHSISATDLYKRVAGVARKLLSWGIGHGDRVAILSENRPEWAIADYAILMVGAASVPIYATLTSEQCSHLLRHSGARAVFVSSEEQLRKVAAVRAESQIEHILMMDPATSSAGQVEDMQAIMDAGPDQRDAELDALARSIVPDDLATLIYTSGTTGVPKGAMLTHGNLASNLDCSLDAFVFDKEEEVSLSFLPLSHITARHVDLGCMFRGVTLAYCPNFDDMPRMLKAIRPTFFVAVPRVYEKIYNAVQRGASSGFKKKIFNWALQVGKDHLTETLAGKRPSGISWAIADRLVFSKVREGIGGRVFYYVSGGAPLGRELAEWYACVGIRIHEGYGLTETSPVVAVNTPEAHRLGTVGRPLPNLEVRIAEDGEILVRGPSVFKGYWNMPEETANAFEGDWFKTGDIGNIDSDGFLSVTDRKKDLIKTSGGKFIAPQPIENSLKANPLIAEAAVIGDKRRFAAVVIAPAFATLEDWAGRNNVPFTTRHELVNHPTIQALYGGIIEDVNKSLAKYEKMKKFYLIPDELSIADGTLTPTLKLRRRNVEARYRTELDKMYASEAPADLPVS